MVVEWIGYFEVVKMNIVLEVYEIVGESFV